MKRHVKPLAGSLLTGAVVLVLGACSSSGSSSGASPASTDAARQERRHDHDRLGHRAAVGRPGA